MKAATDRRTPRLKAHPRRKDQTSLSARCHKPIPRSSNETNTNSGMSQDRFDLTSSAHGGAKGLGHPLVQEGESSRIPAVVPFPEVIIFRLLEPESAGTIIFPSWRSRARSYDIVVLTKKYLFLEWQPHCVPACVPAPFVHCYFGTFRNW